MAIEPPVIDAWSPLSHKTPMGAPGTPPQFTAQSWVPDDDRRRLTAYTILSAYVKNVARFMMDPPSRGADTRKDRREYGDPAMLVNRMIAGILGDEPQIVVDGLEEPLPERPPISDPPVDPGPDVSEMERTIYETQIKVWERDAQATLDAWLAAVDLRPALVERQEWLRQWAEKEGYLVKVWEREEDSVTLGDGVHVFSWSSASGRPVVETYDPGFNFPVITDRTRGFPPKIHFAWEYTENKRKYLRRITFELRPILPVIDWTTGEFLFDPDLGEYVLVQGDRLEDNGQISRQYAWRTERSYTTCYKSDLIWEIEGSPTDWDRLDPADAVPVMSEDGTPFRDLDLMIDFIPVLHVPHTPTGKEHFGVSGLALILQILDDLQGADTDLRKASRLAAGPVMALASGNQAGETTIEPGRVFNVGPNGRMDVLDLSQGLREMRSYVDDTLLNRLSVNACLPAELIGRARVADAASGYAILLAFGPFTQMVQLARRVRKLKDSLALEMVQRLAQAGGVLPRGVNPPVRLVPGAHLPSDRATQIELVVKLMQEFAVSQQTAIQMLIDVGVDVGDIDAEIERIRRENTEAAVNVQKATGSNDLAAERLGLRLPEPDPNQPDPNQPPQLPDPNDPNNPPSP